MRRHWTVHECIYACTYCTPFIVYIYMKSGTSAEQFEKTVRYEWMFSYITEMKYIFSSIFLFFYFLLQSVVICVCMCTTMPLWLYTQKADIPEPPPLVNTHK